jgi:hypothetical protein
MILNPLILHKLVMELLKRGAINLKDMTTRAPATRDGHLNLIIILKGFYPAFRLRVDFKIDNETMCPNSKQAILFSSTNQGAWHDGKIAKSMQRMSQYSDKLEVLVVHTPKSASLMLLTHKDANHSTQQMQSILLPNRL